MTDQEYYNNKANMEFRNQGTMDAWYISKGFMIVSREGSLRRDLVLQRGDRIIKVEEKYREKNYGDFLIEVIQDMVSNNEGWYYAEKPDRISYIILDADKKPKFVYWIKFVEFRDWWMEYLREHKKQIAWICPEGYGITLNLTVPWDKVPEEICKRFTI